MSLWLYFTELFPFRPYHEDHKIKDRQEYLKCVYAFDCSCIACVHNYPTLENYTISFTVPNLDHDPKNFERGQLNEKNIKKKLNEVAHVLNKYSENKFNHQINYAKDIQRSLFECLCNNNPFYNTFKKNN